ncbi:MAG TPA: VWA domain-containing protein [Terrimicrobiaceae bacterium]
MPQNEFLDASSQDNPAQRYAENAENRCPSLLLLDVSGSMQGEPIKQLQKGLEVYRDQLFADSLARKRVEVAVMTFGGKVDLVQSFATADTFTTPKLEIAGDTPMGQAVVEGLQYLEQHKSVLRRHGVAYYRPWVFLITDGAPTDEHTRYWSEAIERVKEGETKRSFSFFSVGVEGADIEKLGELSVREPLKLKGLEFRTLFEWLSASQQTVSKSNPGETVPLQTPSGWAEI